MTLEPADLAPSIAQIDRAWTLLRDVAHPLRSGDLITGHTASYDPQTGVYSLAVRVFEDVNEIYGGTRATRCFRIDGDGSYLAATARDATTDPREVLRARLDAADQLADGEAVDAYGDLSTAVRAFLAATEANAR